jgi:hypothetical protein
MTGGRYFVACNFESFQFDRPEKGTALPRRKNRSSKELAQ